MRWREITVGQRGPQMETRPLTVTDFVRYQGASGDMNPIHHDTEFAQAVGYPGPFAVGMLQAGVMATYATDWLGPQSIRRFAVEFREQAWPKDVISIRGAVTAKRERGGEHFVDIEITAIRQTGGIHIKGTATFVLPA
jgi:acyl dehydratase